MKLVILGLTVGQHLALITIVQNLEPLEDAKYYLYQNLGGTEKYLIEM